MTLGRPFKVCSNDSIHLDLYIANDNYISTTNIDGIIPLSFSQPAGYPTGNYNLFTHFAQTVWLTAGIHTINVEVQNYTVSAPDNPTGLDIYGTVSSATGTHSLISEDSVSCQPAISLAVAPNDTVCVGTPVTIFATVTNASSPSSYQWQVNGNTVSTVANTFTYIPANGDLISFIGTTSGVICDSLVIVSANVSITVDHYNIFSLGPDTALCNGIAYTITSGNSATLWNTGDKGASIVVTQPGLYEAMISNACGTLTDTVRVDYDNCDIWIPNAFTPNGDGKNDIMRVGGDLKYYTNFSFRIFNRWGQCVFYTEDIYAGWDGVFNGVPQNIGTFFYEVFYDLYGTPHMMKGDFQLLR